jgi:molybdopterin-guanine dinucleotide biosynthesis protein A
MVSVVIQAGGKSMRMGSDKILMPFLGQPLLLRVYQRVVPLGQEIFVTADMPNRYTPLGMRTVMDLIPGRGALGGLYTAVKLAKFPLVAVVACDMPFLNITLLKAEIDRIIQSGADVLIPQTPKGLEPLHAIYRKETCLPVLDHAIQDQVQKLISWLPKVAVDIMTPEEVQVFDPGFRSFTNINTPEEFRDAERIAIEDGEK